MALEGNVGTTLLLALLLATTGCIGQVPDLLSTEEEPAGVQPDAAGQDAVDRSEDDERTRTLLLEVGLAEQSGRTISITDVALDPAPKAAEEFVVNPGYVDPGKTRIVVRVVMENGQTLDPAKLHMTVEDGRGSSTIAVELSRWTATQDATQRIDLLLEQAGRLIVQNVEGPLDGQPSRSEAQPSYGAMIWPDGRTRVLPSFPYRVHVPAAYPDGLVAGNTASFSVENAPDGMSWILDGEPASQGPRFETTLEAGLHKLVLVPDEEGERHTLAYAVTDHRVYTDTVVIGAPDPDEQVEDLNANHHGFTVPEASGQVRITLDIVEQATDSDLDLYLLDEEGDVISSSDRDHHSHEQILLPEGVPPGEYVIRVHGEGGALVDYKVSLWVFF